MFSATSPALVVIARAADVAVDAAAVLKALVARFGGKGGGKPDLAQGGGLVGDVGRDRRRRARRCCAAERRAPDCRVSSR